MPQPGKNASLKEWALWHHSHGEAIEGYWVTPILPGKKAPYQKNWSKSPLKSSDEIERHWNENPDDNIGLVPRTGHFWLDVDDTELLERIEAKCGRLPSTYTQCSLNGGLHFLLNGEISSSPTLHFDGKRLGEIRGALSGQCVGAGSRACRKDGRSGAWEIEDASPPADAPTWLLDRINGAGTGTLKDTRKDYGEPIPWDRMQAERLMASVENGALIKGYDGPFLEGERDNLTFQLFAEAKNRMIHPDAMLGAVMDTGIAGGLDAETVERKMESAYHDGNTRDGYGSKVAAYWFPNHVFQVHIDGKPQGLRGADPVAWKSEHPDRLPLAFPGDPGVSPNPAHESEQVDGELVSESFGQLLDTQPVPVVEIIPDHIEKGVVNFLSGPGGSHKSRLALQYCVSIAARLPIFGKMPESALPVFVSAEDDRNEIVRRMHQIAKGLRVHPDALRDGARYLDRYGRDNALTHMSEGGGSGLTPFYSELRNYLTTLPGHKFVVLDSCYDFVRFQGAAKINEDAVNVFIKEVLGGLCRGTDSTLLLTWHPSYSGQDRKDASGWSVAWNNAPRVRDQIYRVDSTDVFSLDGVKRNHGIIPPPLHLRFSSGVLLPISEIETSELDEVRTKAVIQVAALMAEQGVPIRKQARISRTERNLLREKFDCEASEKDFKDILNRAVVDGHLRYVTGDKYRSAGYYPREGADLMAKDAKRRKIDEKTDANSTTKSDAQSRQKLGKKRG